jgi:trigger factor
VKSTVENLSPTRVRLAVEVPFDDLKPSLDAAYRKIGQQIRIPGFRPGKAPARVIDQRVGRSAVLEEAIQDALPRVYSAAAREHSLRPLGQPEIDVTNLSDNESLSFTAEVDVQPEIDLPDLAGIAITVPAAEVSEDDVAEQVDGLRDRFGTLTGVERPVQDGDYVSLDLAASVAGEAVEAGTATGLSYRVGSGDLLDGLDEALTGRAAGETATFTADLQQGEHAGEPAEITATVNSVKTKELPELDDEFAQLASEFDTIDELRADLRTRLGRVRRYEQGGQARDRLVEHLIATIDFPVPESAVQGEVDVREHEVIHSLNHDDALFERYLAMQGTTREQYTAELRESAEKSVRAQFILDAVADREDVQVGDAELTEYLVRQAARYNMAPKQFADEVVQSGNLMGLVADLRRQKALADILAGAEVSDSAGERVDLSALSADDLAELAAGRDDDDDDFETDDEFSDDVDFEGDDDDLEEDADGSDADGTQNSVTP